MLEYYKSLIKSYSDTKFTLKLSDKSYYINNMTLSDNFNVFMENNKEIDNFYFITPYNPCSLNLPKWFNKLQFIILTFILKLLICDYKVCRAKHENFPHEKGVCIFNTNKLFIIFLQLIFGQIAVIEYKDKKCKFIINYMMFFINYMKHYIVNLRIFVK